MISSYFKSSFVFPRQNIVQFGGFKWTLPTFTFLMSYCTYIDITDFDKDCYLFCVCI